MQSFDCIPVFQRSTLPPFSSEDGEETDGIQGVSDQENWTIHFLSILTSKP
jgi:hypothetical protein